MKLSEIKKLQKEKGFEYQQSLVNSGAGWKLEGSYSRKLMELLDCGAIMLPLVETFDYYSNRLPSRVELKEGTKGTLQNTINFYSNLNN